MKAAELRIGNYHLYKIVDIMDERQEWWESCKTDIHDLIILDKKECPNYAPIPLTEEWLLKLGFEKMEFNHSNSYHLDLVFCGIVYNYEGIIEMHLQEDEICLNHIKHVHQLQNLYFALTGEELLI
jgi:hypothetical protein